MFFLFSVLPLFVIVISLFLFNNRRNKSIWKDSHCVITGGSAGLGLGIAKQIIELGGSVTILARNKERLKEAEESLKQLITSDKQKVLSIPTDVTNENAIRDTLDIIKNEHNHIDFLFCCAGVAKPGMFLETPTDVFDQQMQLNYMGIVKSLKVFIPEIIKSKHNSKRVILVSSAMGLSGFIGYSQYSASKFAVRGLAECLRNEFLLYNIGLSIFHASSMNSPGYVVEEQTKPEITKQIEGNSTLFEPHEAALHCIKAVEQGKYHICSEFLMEAMRITGNGLTPRNYPIFECIIGPFLPIICYLGRKFAFDRPVEQLRNSNK